MREPIEVIIQFHQQTGNVINAQGDEHYQVTVIQAPGVGFGGPISGKTLNMNEIGTIQGLYRHFVDAYQQMGAAFSLDELQLADERTLHPLRLIGQKLYEVLPETVQSRIDYALTVARQERQALSLILAFKTSADGLLALPWELLYHPEGRFFFALQGGGIKRQLVLLPQWQTRGDFRPQNVLGIWAEPQNIESLNDRRQSGPSPSNSNFIDWREGNNTLAQIEQALANDDTIDSLHIVAHGKFGAEWGSLSLAFVNREGNVQWVSPDQLAILFSQYLSLRFVYLDVCHGNEAVVGDGNNETVNGSQNDGESAILDILPSGVARRFLGAGLEGVILMQDAMGQKAAGLLAHTFYKNLAEGQTWESALTAARIAVRLQQDDPIHWSMPVFYRQPPNPTPVIHWTDKLLDQTLYAKQFLLIFPILAMIPFIGWLTEQLSQFRLDQIEEWPRIAVYLVSSAFICIMVAAITTDRQEELGQRYKLKGRAWFPFLISKYFQAALWPLTAWLIGWSLWFTIYMSGLDNRLSAMVHQLIWLFILILVALFAHMGARVAMRQSFVFFRVDFVPFRSLLSVLAILLALFVVPFLPPFFVGWGLWFYLLFDSWPIPFSLFLLMQFWVLGLLAFYVFRRDQRDDTL
ncbi:MAG TPA: CHAT domain-containing protein [Anaerolineae bacterium]|nr:CHAT domain-containing protein [Anaerolineae bacterium]